MKRRNDIEDIQESATELLSLIQEIAEHYTDMDDVYGELRVLANYAHIIAEKAPKICRLRDFKGYKFAVIDPETGEPRKATKDEALRLIMDYKTGSFLDIYKEWTVVNGKWVKRPEENPKED